MTTNAEKAQATLDAASLFQTEDGIKIDDWPKVAVLLSIANTQAQASIAESLERLANKHAPRPRGADDRPLPGAYL